MSATELAEIGTANAAVDAPSPATTATAASTTEPTKAKKPRRKKKKPDNSAVTPAAVAVDSADDSMPAESPSAARDLDLLPPAAPAVVQFEAGAGRHLVVAADIEAGSAVFEDAPYVYCALYERRQSVCAYCLSGIAPAASMAHHCAQCGLSYYCSAHCQSLAWSSRHSIECSMLRHALSIARIHDSDINLLAMLIGIYARRWREVKRSEGVDQWSKGSLDDQLTFEHVLDLVYHPSLSSSDWLRAIRASCEALLQVSPDPALMSVDLMLELAQRVNGNSHSCCALSGDSSAIIGLGLYCRVSLMNHSCEPSAHYVTQRHGRMMVRARTNLSIGDVLTVHYCDLYEDRETRQRLLLKEKGFVCRCPRCSLDIKQSVDRLVAGVFCEHCKSQAKPPSHSHQPASTIVQSLKRGSALSDEEVERYLARSAASSSLIVFKGDATKPINSQRKDFACLQCGRRSSLADVQSMLRPLHAFYESAMQLKSERKWSQCQSQLLDLLDSNEQQRFLVTGFHPVCVQAYVLLYSLSTHLQAHAVSVSCARLIVHCYDRVFVADFIESANWLEALVESLRHQLQVLQSKRLSAQSKAIMARVSELRAVEQRWRRVKRICFGSDSATTTTTSSSAVH